MKLARRVLLVAVAVISIIFILPSGASAQTGSGYDGYDGYGEDGAGGRMVTEEIARLKADADGSFRFPYQVPEDIEDSFDVYVVGTAEDGGPFEYQLASITKNVAGKTVILEGSNLAPDSEFILQSRRRVVGEDPEGPAAGTSPADASDIEAAVGLPGGDDSNRRVLGGLAVVALLMAAAVVYGLRLTGREAL